jgi:energy-coupling factor transporter ATP-binding protein EcfA2
MELDLGKVTILIGEQASGKSTVAKVLCICRYFSYLIENTHDIVNGKSAFSRRALGEWDLDEYETPTTFIKYENTDYSLIIDPHVISGSQWALSADSKTTSDIGQFELSVLIPKLEAKSEAFKNLLNRFEELKPKESQFSISSNWSIPHSFLTTDVKQVMNNPFYFPTERGLQSVFSLGKSSIENLSDSLYNQFALLAGIAKGFGSVTDIEPLGIQYKNEDGQGKIRKHGEDMFFSLSKGASGYQSATPIVLAVKHYSAIRRKRTFIVEEPEQNLFPAAQKKLMEFLTGAVNENGHQMLLTTHSPYILTALEVLTYAFKLGHLENGKYRERVAQIVDERLWIDQADVTVYALSEGTAANVMLRNDALIDKQFLDSVSKEVIHEFDSLLEIDVEHENGDSL